MDLGPLSSSRDFVKCYNCGCSFESITGTSESWLRSVKRKYDEFEGEGRFAFPWSENVSVARVEFENECVALREMVGNQQQAIQDLYTELEEERNSASTAANETMTMILRLQREKAEIQMEARQFKRFAEEKMEHNQQEVLALEDLLYKREQIIQSLACEVQAYKHRMLSFGLIEAEAEGQKGMFSLNLSMLDFDTQHEIPMFEYPPLRCSLNEAPGGFEADNEDDVADIEKFAFGETPRNRDHLKNLERRINQMERSPSNNQLDGDFPGSRNVLDKVIVGQSPRRSRHTRKFSNDSSSLRGVVRENGVDPNAGSPRFGASCKKTDYVSQPDECNARKADSASDDGDDTNYRVYTIDSVHDGAPYNGSSKLKSGIANGEDSITTPRGPSKQVDATDPDIKKLYTRLQALEADRESMRQTILSMGTDKAQLVLLKEIAQQLCKERSPERKITMKKPSLFGSLPFLSVFKWIVSFIFWRRKARRSKYLFGVSPSDIGLLMLLDKGPRTRPWRCLTRTQV